MAKTFTGTVSSAAVDKTIVVTVNRSKTHPLYHKQYTVSTKFMAHDEQNEAQVGDRVIIIETRPVSKRKHFALSKVVEKAAVRHTEAEVPEVIQEVAQKEEASPAPVKTEKKAKKAEPTEEPNA